MFYFYRIVQCSTFVIIQGRHRLHPGREEASFLQVLSSSVVIFDEHCRGHNDHPYQIGILQSLMLALVSSSLTPSCRTSPVTVEEEEENIGLRRSRRGQEEVSNSHIVIITTDIS